jgi:hypothetical protein
MLLRTLDFDGTKRALFDAMQSAPRDLEFWPQIPFGCGWEHSGRGIAAVHVVGT